MFWRDQFCHKLIEMGHTVIRFDHRDQGLSDGINWDKKPYTLDDLVQDVINILDAYQINKAHVVGHSMGGSICQLLAIKHPERLISFTSMSAANCGLIGQPSKEIMDILLENQPTQNFTNDLSGFMRSWEILNGDYEVNNKIAEQYYTKDLYIRSKHPVGVAWHHIWCQQNYADLTNDLQKIKVPGMFIHGGKDPLIPLAAGVKTQNLVTNAKMVVIPGMGHMFFSRDLEDLIAQHLLEYFKSKSTT